MSRLLEYSVVGLPTYKLNSNSALMLGRELVTALPNAYFHFLYYIYTRF